jgi:hypothetical protein
MPVCVITRVYCIFVTLLEDGTLAVQAQYGHNSFFSLGTSHDSILELAEEEEEMWIDR